MRVSCLIACAPLVLAAACSQSSKPVDSDAVLDQIHQVEKDQEKAMNDHDAAAAVAVYAPDAVFIAPGTGLLNTPEGIRADFDEMAKDENLAFAMGPGNDWVSNDGGLAVTVANFNYTYTDPESGDAKSIQGVNQTAWQKQEDGSWKIIADFNAETPKATAQ